MSSISAVVIQSSGSAAPATPAIPPSAAPAVGTLFIGNANLASSTANSIHRIPAVTATASAAATSAPGMDLLIVTAYTSRSSISNTAFIAFLLDLDSTHFFASSLAPFAALAGAPSTSRRAVSAAAAVLGLLTVDSTSRWPGLDGAIICGTDDAFLAALTTSILAAASPHFPAASARVGAVMLTGISATTSVVTVRILVGALTRSSIVAPLNPGSATTSDSTTPRSASTSLSSPSLTHDPTDTISISIVA
jgi:hypothetical protein